ncbi:PP2C family protein-serine/threonine phosphatase [Roseospirillum parvum]|uniref:Sigma-B regulation protein RsbU (Phosphoserine phosphatase) n=1 Tax=Roseospirillum parvum TaxID=83401 RepID=A0A1G7UYJ2_9PROT|nr:PP2C family protein-serine/threonine phosphatase [Roseospirillum parvum]SDG51780.1 sigma-B regulation protein RsbU (phosphoserine phosphatase) [Roseospirillum parvum]
MSIQWKLLVVILVVALPPLLMIAWLDRAALSDLGDELRLVRREALVMEAGQRLQGLAQLHAADLMASADEVPPPGPLPGLDLSRHQPPEAWAGALEAQVVAAGAIGAGEVQSGAAALLAATALSRPAGFVIGRRGGDGAASRVVAFARLGARLGDSPRALALTLPVAALEPALLAAEARAAGAIERHLAVSGTALALFLTIAVAFSVIFARTITRPLASLNRAVRDMAEGHLDAKVILRTGDEIEALADSVNQMLPKLRDRLKMRDALSLAMEVQQHLLPAAPPVIGGFDIAGQSVYCDETGGDYYDFIDLSELAPERIGVAVGDVTGHGVAAALLMTTARALLRSRARLADHGPALLQALGRTVGEINRHLAEDTQGGRFMTLFYAIVDGGDATIRWVSAGHLPALIYDPETDYVHRLEGEDIPLGIDPDWTFRAQERGGWMKGQIIAIGTDGIYETKNPEGEMFGQQRFVRVLRRHADRPAAEICAAVVRALARFRGGRAQEDDVTLVIVRKLA